MNLIDKIPKPLVLPVVGLATAGLMTLAGSYATQWLSGFINNNAIVSNTVYGAECVIGSIIMKRPTSYVLGQIYDMGGKMSFRHPIESIKSVWNNYYLRRDVAIFGASLILVTGGSFFVREHYYDKFVRQGDIPKKASRKIDLPLNSVRAVYYNALGIALMSNSFKNRKKKEEQ